MKMHRAKIGGRLHRTLRTTRPSARAMLMTTALAWSIGVPPPATAAAPMARPAASAASVSALPLSPPSPTPRSTRARRP